MGRYIKRINEFFDTQELKDQHKNVKLNPTKFVKDIVVNDNLSKFSAELVKQIPFLRYFKVYNKSGDNKTIAFNFENVVERGKDTISLDFYIMVYVNGDKFECNYNSYIVTDYDGIRYENEGHMPNDLSLRGLFDYLSNTVYDDFIKFAKFAKSRYGIDIIPNVIN
jgi:hypothetical protein